MSVVVRLPPPSRCARHLPRERGRKIEAGFTLLELLVAMSLVGLLTLVLFGGMHLGRRVWEASDLATQNENHVRMLQSDLTAMLARAYPEMVHADATHAHVAFDGADDRLTWLTESAPGSGQMLRITLARSGDAITETMAPELSPPSRARTLVRLNHVTELAFAYYGAPTADGTPAWQAHWQDAAALPELVRIRVRFNQAQLRWPELIVAPRITADASCQFDALTKTCQGT